MMETTFWQLSLPPPHKSFGKRPCRHAWLWNQRRDTVRSVQVQRWTGFFENAEVWYNDVQT
jgi:hypothetical protein